MQLSDLIESLQFENEITENWSILGPEAGEFASKLKVKLSPDSAIAHRDGVLLAGALSAQVEPQSWLVQVTEQMKTGAVLVAIDWQSDGLLNHGPELERRFKKGKLQRLLRERGFGLVDLLDDQPMYYVIRAQKGPTPPNPHAHEFVEVAGLDELPKNAMKKIQLFGQNIIVANTGKEIVAFAQKCPHANGSLDEGILRGRNIACPLHGYMWNVRSGEPIEPADEDILPCYRVKAEDGRVFVALAPPERK
jgi:nitrite reductase/ring-hydroxylating ferredoxin subunit